MRLNFCVLLFMNPNPVIGQVKCAMYLIGHMTARAATHPIHRAQARMFSDGRTVASKQVFSLRAKITERGAS